jgi:hypothetical protein
VLPSTAKNRTRVVATGAGVGGGGVARGALVGPVDLDRAGHHRRDDDEQRLVVRSVDPGLGALDHHDADQLAEHHRGHRDLALGVDQTRERDLASRCLTAVFLVAAPDGARVGEHAPEVADPHRLGAVGHHADDAVAHAHLGTDAFARVAVAGDGEEALALLVEQEEQGVLVAEQLGEARQGGADDGVEVGAAGETLAQPGQLADLLAAGPQFAGHRSTRSTAARTCSISTTR